MVTALPLGIHSVSRLDKFLDGVGGHGWQQERAGHNDLEDAL